LNVVMFIRSNEEDLFQKEVKMLKNINQTSEGTGIYRNKWTALHFAAFYGKDKMIKFLLNNKADQNIKDRNGKLAVDVCSEYDCEVALGKIDE